MRRLRTGIDISPTTITAVQVRLGSSSWRPLAFATMARQGEVDVLEPGEARAFESLLFRKGFASAPCIISAPAGALHSTTMDLPPVTSGAPVDQLARAEFARRNKLAVGSFELSYWDLPTPGPALQVMAVGCESAPTDQTIDALEAAGLRVAGVDDPARALGRVLAAAPTIATVRVGVRLEAWGCKIVVLHHTTLLYSRSPAGLAYSDASSEIEHVEVARRLASEIDACVAFARHRCRSHAPAAVSVFGEAAASEVLVDMLAQRYGEALSQPVLATGEAIDPVLAPSMGLALLEDAA